MRTFICATVLLSACIGDPARRPADDAVPEYQRAAAGGIGTRTGSASCLTTLDPADSASQPPARLSQTGCFSDLASFAPANHVAWYGVNSELYSDGAHKLRFMALPTTATLDLNQTMEQAPVGLVLIKVFELTMAGNDTPQPVEVRFMQKHNRGWRVFTYRWNAELADGELLNSRQVDTLTVQTTQGASEIAYLYPAEADCRMCHNPATPFILGPRPEQLKGTFIYEGQSRNQLDVLAQAGYLAAVTTSAEPWPDPLDPSAPIEARARSYLAANCSHCHTPGGTTTAELTLDLRYAASLADSHLCDEAQYFAEAGTLRVAPGAPDQSWIIARLEAHGKMRMPPLGLNLYDEAGIAVLREWIAQLTDCPR